jgi:uncharacterized integral membrane protein
MKKNARLIIAAVVALLILVVVLQNLDQAPTRILFFTITMPRALLLFITLLIGFIIGLLFASRPRKTTPPPKI